MRRAWGTGGAIAVSQFSDDGDRFSPGDTVYLKGGREARVVEPVDQVKEKLNELLAS